MLIKNDFGYWNTKEQGKHDQIRYNRGMEILETYRRMTPGMRLNFDRYNPSKNESGYWFYQGVYKLISYNETAKKVFEAGKITYEYYQYLITPIAY